jgi:ABC-type Fe3+/spermidine/putrescine transport system ATPase subunit
MHAGRMEQVGTPRDIYDTPTNRFVAEFMGVGNLWQGTVLPDGLTMELSCLATIRLPAAAAPGPAVLGVRAERIHIRGDPAANLLIGVAERTIYAGDIVTHSIRLGNGTTAHVAEPAHGAGPVAGEVTLSFPPAACMVFPA